MKEEPKDMPEILIIEKQINIYGWLEFADIHSTTFSTCVIESLIFWVPNVMCNYQDWSKPYYGDVLGNDKHTLFIETPSKSVNAILNHWFESKEYIAGASEKFFDQDFQQNIKNFIEKEFKA